MRSCFLQIDEMRINLFMNKNFVGAIPHRTELDEIKAKINFDGTGVHFVLENMVNNETIFSTYFASEVVVSTNFLKEIE